MRYSSARATLSVRNASDEAASAAKSLRCMGSPPEAPLAGTLSFLYGRHGEWNRRSSGGTVASCGRRSRRFGQRVKIVKLRAAGLRPPAAFPPPTWVLQERGAGPAPGVTV